MKRQQLGNYTVLCAKSVFMRQGHHMLPKKLKQHQHVDGDGFVMLSLSFCLH